jgi:hypothetical protein
MRHTLAGMVSRWVLWAPRRPRGRTLKLSAKAAVKTSAKSWKLPASRDERSRREDWSPEFSFALAHGSAAAYSR